MTSIPRGALSAPEYEDALRTLYENQEKTCREIGEIFGYSGDTVRLALIHQVADLCWENGVIVSYSEIYRIELGVRPPRPELRSALAKILGLDHGDLDATEK